MENNKQQFTPESFKQKVITAHPDAVDSKGIRYADIPADELLNRMIEKNPDAMTSEGIPYKNYLGNVRQTPKEYEQEQANPVPDGGVIRNALNGKPLAPATTADVGGEGSGVGGNPLKIIGKTAVNVFSDAPTLFKGLVDTAIHPIDTAKGLVDYYANIAKESFGAIKEGIETKDWTRLKEDVQKAEMNIINHPLQTIAMLEGTRSIAKGGAQLAKSPVKTATEIGTKVADSTIGVVEKGKSMFQNMKQGLKDKGISFATDSTLHQKAVEQADVISQIVEQQKKVADTQKALNDMKAKSEEVAAKAATKTQEQAGKVKEKGTAIQEKTLEEQNFERDLRLQKRELADMEKANKQAIKETTDTAKEDFSNKGFTSLGDMSTTVRTFFKDVKTKLGEIYDENLGNAKVDITPIFKGIDKFQDYLYTISDRKALNAIKPMLDNLKVREIVTKYGDDSKKLYGELTKQKIDTSIWENLTEEQLKREYPVIDSSNIKGIRTTLEETIRENNKDALKNFDTNVKSAFKDSFKEAIRSEYGDEVLQRLEQNDANWSELQKNPLSSIENPTLADITKNWKSFVKNAEQLPEGQKMIEQIQNVAGKQVLEGAQNAVGTYSVEKINNGIKKYGDILGDEVKGQLEDIVDMYQASELVSKNAEAKIDKTKIAKEDITQEKKKLVDEQKIEKETLKKLEEEQKKAQEDAKSIGETPADVIKAIKEIKTTEELTAFLEKTGKSVEEVRAALMQSIVEIADPKLNVDKTAPFDVNKAKEIVKSIDEIGKSADATEYKKINNELVGEEGIKARNELEKQIKEYDKAVTEAGKSQASRFSTAAFGALLIAFNHVIWGGMEIAKSMRGSKKGKEDISGRERPTLGPKKKPASTRQEKIQKILKLGKRGGVAAKAQTQEE